MVKNTMPAPLPIPNYFIESPQADEHYYRVRAFWTVSNWIEQQEVSLWKHSDIGRKFSYGQNYLVMPELATMLALKFG